MKRAYIATVEIEIVVVAESKEAAQKLAVKAFQDEHVYPEDFELQSLSYIPAAYSAGFNITEDDLENLVWHDGPGDLTLREALKMPGGYEHPDNIDKRKAKIEQMKTVAARVVAAETSVEANEAKEHT